MQQLAQIDALQHGILLVVDAGLGQQLAQQAVAAIEGQQHLAQRLAPARFILRRQGVFAVDPQHRQRCAQFVGRLVGELLLPLQGVGQGVHQPVDLPHQRRQFLGLDGQIEGAQVGGVTLADGLGQLAQRRQTAGDQPPQQAEQEGEGDEEWQHGEGGHLAGQLSPLVISLRDDEPGLLALVEEGEGAPVMAISTHSVKADGQLAEQLGWCAGGAQQQPPLAIGQLEGEIAFKFVAVGGQLPVLATEIESLLLGVAAGVLLGPVLVEGAIGGQCLGLLEVVGQQLVGDAGRLGKTGIKQLLHLVARLQITDEGAEGQADADQGQYAGEQEAADGAGAVHGADASLVP